MQRFADYYRDSDPRALEVFLSLQRCRTVAEKMTAVFRMNEMLRGWQSAECAN
jgi:hypothetical protein